MGAGRAPASASAQVPFEWTPAANLPGAVDVAGPRRDGRFAVAVARAPLRLFRPGGGLKPLGAGKDGHTPSELAHEPYIALGDGHRMRAAGCRFRSDHVFQVENKNVPNVVEINRRGVGRNLAELPPRAFLSAITFDQVGEFGGRLLVAARFGTVIGDRTVDIYGIDCEGRTKLFVNDAPEVEGGMAVAPASFDPYGGRLIAPDEIDGNVFAYRPEGSWKVIATPGPPVGYDHGIESISFVPAGFGPGDAAYMADRTAPLNDDLGTGALMHATAEQLAAAGVEPGDMIGAAESRLEAFRFECAAGGCSAAQVGTGPDTGHGEGHIAFGPAP